jgi:type IV secretion system protein VirB10
MTDPLDTDLLKRDVDGTALRIRGTPRQTGARLSKNFKKVAAAALGLMSAGILVGIFTAGNRPKGGESGAMQGAGAETAMVGETQPDLDAMERSALEQAQQRAAHGTEAVGAGGVSPGIPETTLSVSREALGEAPALRSGPPDADPAQKYRQWLAEERYKVLESQGLAAESATSATLMPEGSEPAVAGAGNSATPPSPVSPENPLSQLLQTAQGLQPSSGESAISPGTLASLATGATGGTRPEENTIPSTGESQATDRAFLDGQATTDTDGYLAAVRQPPAADYELFAGSIIPAVLVTGIQSDLPGSITAIVRQTVYDSRRPEVVLIPQGTRLVGLYTSQVAYGQERVLVAWNRLIFPNGSTIELGGMEGTDGLGEAGLADRVNNHYTRIFGSAILMSLLGAGAELSQPQNSSALTAPSMSQQTATAIANELNQVGTTLIGKNLAIQPTLTIRPGYAFDVFLNRTIILKPYLDQR